MAKTKTKPDEITALRIKELRKNREMTQSKLAEKIGKQIQAVNAYENVRQGIPNKVLSDISIALNTSVEYLTGQTDEPNPLRQALLKMEEAWSTTRDELMGQQIKSQIINAAETLFLGMLYNYKITFTCGTDKEDPDGLVREGSVVISLFKNGEEYIFDSSEFSDLLKDIGSLLDFECFKIKQKRACEETPLLLKAQIVLNREQREESAQINSDAVLSLYKKKAETNSEKEDENNGNGN